MAMSTAASVPAAMLSRAEKYRGATVADLDPPAALSLHPTTPIHAALLTAYERDYTHLTITSAANHSLQGYVSIPRLRALLEQGAVREDDAVDKAMVRFRRRGRRYTVITLDTPLEELEAFFEGEDGGGGEGGSGEGGRAEKRQRQDFAVVTDADRKFVLGVATRADLDEFVRRRPAV